MTESPNPSIRTVGVVGAGTMGHGIAQALVRQGYSVVLHDLSPKILKGAVEKIARGLGREVEKGRLKEEEKSQALSRLKTAARLEELAPVDFVLEAVPEIFELKAEVFRSLETLPQPPRAEVVFASNTSSISITQLAAQTRRPSGFVGMHFFNPVPAMKLVEIVSGLETSPETVQAATDLAVSLGKSPIRVNDYPGFVSNRVLMPMINEAVFCLMEGVAEPRAIDGVMKLGMNHPMGPLELADLIGLDVCLDILKVLHEGFRDSKYRPCPLLEKMVNAGWLGRKTGRGFYTYPQA
ncbi:MAG: 3-hydroxybutyryl-CoA dehydrogenase [Acidobacteria bacterium]|nr:MAG: 3-hydroxybutyryl-CoA dehydrogenase [Acidobacteriota bacterium]